jgi:hypothetical protein
MKNAYGKYLNQNKKSYNNYIIFSPTKDDCFGFSNINNKKQNNSMNIDNGLTNNNIKYNKQINNNLNEMQNINRNIFDPRLELVFKYLSIENNLPIFINNNINFNDLLILTRKDLIDLGIPMIDRNRILYFSPQFIKYAKNYSLNEINSFFHENKNLYNRTISNNTTNTNNSKTNSKSNNNTSNNNNNNNNNKNLEGYNNNQKNENKILLYSNGFDSNYNNKNNNNYKILNNKNNFISKHSFREKKYTNKIQPALFNLQMLKNQYDNIYHRMFEISNELNKKNKINLKKNPYLFVSKQEMIDDINQNSFKSQYFVIYLLQCLLENVGVMTVVERKCEQPELASDLLQMIVSGIGLLPVYEFHMDFGDEENFKILFDKNVQKSYVENWKNRLAHTLKIDKKYIFITDFRNGSVKSKFFVGKKLKSNEKFKIKKEFENELVKDSEIKEKGPLLKSCKLSTEMMEPKFDNYLKWAPKGEKRGGEDYDSPIGWMGFGLKVLGKYDNGDNKWIGMKNIPGEFPVAYHGVGRACKPFDIVNKIVDNGFVAGAGQQYANYDDIRHPGQKCSQGAYFTPIIDEAARYAGSGEALNKRFKVVFMCRVNKDKIREPDRGKNAPYWILDGSKEQVRPYRILIKEN